MSPTENDRRVDYIEFPATDVTEIKRFYGDVFGWSFQDFGSEYTSFSDGRLTGGFFAAPQVQAGGPLVVIYTIDLEAMESKIKGAGGSIVKETFEFPGGRRFHFTDPSGNVLAVWSDS